jgi:site-specific recombinase XerD
MRTKNLISYPKYNRCKGNLNKKWYVEFSYRLPSSDDLHKYRCHSGLCSGTAEERDLTAKKLIDYYTEYLKSGSYLHQEPNLNPLKESETHRPEHQRYMREKKSIMVDSLVARYLDYVKPNVRSKTYQDYSTRLKAFVRYTQDNLDGVTVPCMQRKMIIPFFEQLATRNKLCRRTIEKYMQTTRQFFAWCEDIGVREDSTNPVVRVPKFGNVIDCSTGVFDLDERKRLRDAIKPREPFLWLACEMLYYCAIRPGTEMRLMKIGDIDFVNRNICVRAELAKNKTTEFVGMPECLLQYMFDLHLNMFDRDMYIFGRYGQPSLEPMGKNTMRNRFNSYRELLKISKDKKFYSWKHAGAISAAQNGATIFELKDQLRHKSIVTTEEYLKKRQPKTGAAAKKMDKL